MDEITQGKSSCRIEGEAPRLRLVLGFDGRKIADFGLAYLLAFSVGKPWELVGPRAQNARVMRQGQVLIVEARQAFQGVSARLELSFSRGRLAVAASWTNEGEAIPDAVLGLRFGVDGSGMKCTLPHLIYNDNPSAEAGLVIPRVGKEAGKGFVCEEHRLPIPGLNLQWEEGGAFPYLSVLALPSLIEPADIDSCWSQGILKTEGGYAGLFLSGALMFNGERDLVYGGQCSPIPYSRGYFDFASGMRVEKRLELAWGDELPEGQGFRNLVREAWELFEPRTEPAMGLEELIELKKNCLDSRFREDGKSAGYSCFGSANACGNVSKRPEYYLYAWTGEALKLAWCDAYLGLGEGDESRVERASRTVDFFVEGSVRGDSGLPFAYYLYESGKWGGAWFDVDDLISSRMVGCSVSDLIDCMTLFRERGRPVPAAWKAFVASACEALTRPERLTADGVFPLKWRLDGRPDSELFTSAGIPCATALAKAGALLGDSRLTSYAEDVLERYYGKTARSMDFPFAYSTLDAKCEDKEAGMYFFSSALELYRITRKQRYLDWAGIAADWIMTFQFVWEPPVRPDSVCARQGFRMVGWPGVSPQNHHLDVFFPATDLVEYGELSGDPLYGASGRAVMEAWTHGVCALPGDYGFTVRGEQAEQYYNSNYVGARLPRLLERTGEWRGGSLLWNPSWIIAEVLQAALKFRDGDKRIRA
jgi:hypothetical protein